MLIIQYNFRWGYESTINKLETALSIGAGVVCLQEPFLKKKNIIHSAFNFYWPGGLRTEARVLTATENDLVDKIVIDNKSDLADHPNFLVLNIRDIDKISQKATKRTRVINAHDNRIGQSCIWEGSSSRN